MSGTDTVTRGSELRSASTLIWLIGLLLVVALALLLWISPLRFAGGAGTGGPLAPVASLSRLSQDAPLAADGSAEALASVQRDARSLRELAAQNSAAGWARDARLAPLLAAAGTMLAAQQPLIDAGAAVRDVNMLAPRMLQQLGEVAAKLPSGTLDALARPLERFEVRAQRLQIDLGAVAIGSPRAAQAAQRLAESSDYLSQVIRGLAGTDTTLGLPRLESADARRALAQLGQESDALTGDVRRVIDAAPQLPAAQDAARTVAKNARELAAMAAAAGAGGSATLPGWLPLLPLLLALLPLAMLLRRLHGMRRAVEQQRMNAAMQHKEADRNQEAILRLLDELSSLADGDLTVKATVTEDMTGAIADSINYAVDALRGLVTTINSSAVQLDGAVRQTTSLAQVLAKAANAQSKQISGATESVAEMAVFTEEVSGNAERGADVARHSVDVAHKGGDAVRRTIDGMNSIRETIQETSKRIKRLGESSQEIGNIVELINDIAEQTNILALNASIQASMAGEAGRGFAVVADEVQRLAERAANATKQIEVLVRTIQTDTNEAVVSMERSTTDVVGGALLAENAGAALEEIEQVSNQIASLVQNISSSSRQQSGAAQNIARNMQVLKEISSQTADSTSATSQAIAKLAELSSALRTSVSGFRLPGDTSSSGQHQRLDSEQRAAAGVVPLRKREPLGR